MAGCTSMYSFDDASVQYLRFKCPAGAARGVQRRRHIQKLDFSNLGSAFDYSLVAEKELPNILRIIDVDDGQIGKIGGLVDNRNEMAHANGRFAILNEDTFSTATNGIIDSVRNIHRRMDKQIRLWFVTILLRYCNNEFADYDNNITDIVKEQMIQSFNLSVRELMVCNEMSAKTLNKENPQFKNVINKFKRELKNYCEEQGFIG